MDAKQAKRIKRDRFVEVIRQSQLALEAEISLYLQRLDQLRCLLERANIAEYDGMRVSFFETEDSVFFTSEPKGQIGFTTPEGKDGKHTVQADSPQAGQRNLPTVRNTRKPTKPTNGTSHQDEVPPPRTCD